MIVDGDEGTKGMSEAQNPAIEWIIANTINDTARGDPDALAGRIIAALAQAGYRIISRKSLIALLEDSAQGSQPFAKLTREKRPQDPHGDGRDWKFITCEFMSMVGTSPTPCLKQSKPPTLRGVRRFMCHSLAAEKSRFCASNTATTRGRGSKETAIQPGKTMLA
jgi:hypothetical protein